MKHARTLQLVVDLGERERRRLKAIFICGADSKITQIALFDQFVQKALRRRGLVGFTKDKATFLGTTKCGTVIVGKFHLPAASPQGSKGRPQS